MNLSADQLEFVKCNGCNSDSYDVHFEQEDTRYSSTPRGKFRLVKCRKCALIYLNPRPTEAAIGAYYPDSFYEERPTDLTARSGSGSFLRKLFDNAGRRKRNAIREKIDAVRRFRSQPGLLLDVGCAAGEFLESMKALGWRVEGADISQAMCTHVRSKLGIPCHEASINHLRLEPGVFDVITFWASMEHLYDPRSALRICHQALAENGLVVILVPNADSLEEKWLRKIDKNPIDIPRHLYHFSPTTLAGLLTTEAFEPILVKHHTLNAADRFTVVMTDFLDERFKTNSLPAKVLSIAMRMFVESLGDAMSLALATIGRSHSFIVVARRRSTVGVTQRARGSFPSLSRSL